MKTILIIEDDSNLSENLSIQLSNAGFKIITADNGIDGYKHALDILPDLIICDIMMPKMDGYKVKEKLNKTKRTLDIPIIFLTAKTEISDLRKGMNLGADDYIFKPYKVEDLLKSINIRLKKSERIKAGFRNSTISTPKRYGKDDSIFLTINGEPKFIKISDIIYIRAERQYVNLCINFNSIYLIRKPLSHWDMILPSRNFFRIHRSAIINSEYISKIEKWFNSAYRIHLKNISEPFILSRRYAKLIKFEV